MIYVFTDTGETSDGGLHGSCCITDEDGTRYQTGVCCGCTVRHSYTCLSYEYYFCVHCLQVLLPLIDEYARRWLLLQADLRQRRFFAYDSCPAARGGTRKSENSLSIVQLSAFDNHDSL